MHKNTAEALLSLINNPYFEQDIEIYIKYRTEANHRLLEQAQTIDQVRQAQGALTELNELRKLRELVLSKSKE